MSTVQKLREELAKQGYSTAKASPHVLSREQLQMVSGGGGSVVSFDQFHQDSTGPGQGGFWKEIWKTTPSTPGV